MLFEADMGRADSTLEVAGEVFTLLFFGFSDAAFLRASVLFFWDQPVWTKPDQQPQQNIEPGTSETCHCVRTAQKNLLGSSLSCFLASFP